MRRYLFLFVLGTVVFRLWACQCDIQPPHPDGGSDAGDVRDGAVGDPLAILTTTLPNAIVSQTYDQRLEADGGVPPIGWSFVGNVPASLAWLSLSADGRLTGFPLEVLPSPGASFVVQATDSADASVQQGLTLIIGCQPGTVTCGVANGAACEVGTRTCNADGTLTACIGTSPSSDIRLCSADGGTCGSCDQTRANNCANGLCQCGANPACIGDPMRCCTNDGGACANFDSPTTCGACDNDCNTKIAQKQNVHTGCVAGTETCTFPCNQGFADCDGPDAGYGTDTNGCETSLATGTNCGYCGNDCTAHVPTNAAYSSCTSTGGTCHYTCQSGLGWQNCSGGDPNNGDNGCTTNIFTNAVCGSCGGPPCPGVAGHVASSNNCSNGTCQFSCGTGGNPATTYITCGGGAVACGCGGFNNATPACTGTNNGTCTFTCTGNAIHCPVSDPNGCNCVPPPNAVAICGGGTNCTFSCNPGFSQCGSSCVDEQSDPLNCGSCGNNCNNVPPYTSCVSGSCVEPCGSTHCSQGQTCYNNNSVCDRQIGRCLASSANCTAPIQCIPNNCHPF